MPFVIKPKKTKTKAKSGPAKVIKFPDKPNGESVKVGGSK